MSKFIGNLIYVVISIVMRELVFCGEKVYLDSKGAMTFKCGFC